MVAVQEGVPSHEQLVVQTLGLTPKRVNISVGVPRRFYQSVWEDRNRSANGQPAGSPSANDLQAIEDEIKKNIENMAVNLIPEQQPGQSQYPLVHVSTNDVLDIAPPPEPGVMSQHPQPC